MRISIAALYFFFNCLSSGHAQQISGEEKEYVQTLLDSAGFYNLKKPEHCIQIATKILSLIPVEGNEETCIRALLFAANSEKILSRQKEALEYSLKAIAIAEKKGDPELMIRAYFMRGSIFGQADNNDSTMIYYQKVIDAHRPGIDAYYVSSAYTNVGLVYDAINNFPKAEEYLLKGYKLTSGDDRSKLFALAAVITFYVTQHNPKYLPYLDTLSKSEFYKKASPESFMAHFDSFLLLDEATDADKVKTLREVYEYAQAHSSLTNQVGFGMRLYEQLDKMHQFETAHPLLQDLYQKAVKANNIENTSAVIHALYENSKSRGDLLSALKYLERHSQLRDSLLSEENTSRISELNIKFEAAQKDHEILQQKSRIEQERRNRDFFILLAFVLTALAVVVFFYLRNKVRLSHRLAEKEKVIHQQETLRLHKEKEVAELTATLESQEKERNRIARDLHDGLGSMMSGISSQIEYLRAQPGNEQAQPNLIQLREMVKDATSELRRTSYELMPAKLLRLGLEPAIRDLCLNLLVKNGIEPALEINTDLITLNPEQQLTLYRIVQELLNNIVKHAEAKQVLIQFTRFDDEISLVVEDDGKGFDLANRKSEDGLGLGSLGSRVNLLNGFLDIASMPGEGTTVTVNFNIGAEPVPV